MKIVLALTHVAFFRHHDRMVRNLCRMGHEVRIVANELRPPGMRFRPVRACLDEMSGASYERMIKPSGHGYYWLSRMREILNYAFYFTPNHPSPHLRERWVDRLPRPLRAPTRYAAVRTMLASRPTCAAMRAAASIVPVDEEITRWLSEYSPDVVIASPGVFGNAVEVEYLRAAMSLGIPTVMSIASWDNLTTKGTFHVTPDLVFVWNEAMRDEATTLHSVPRERVYLTGALPFDAWFDKACPLERGEFCERVGMDPAKPFIVYTCSSSSIAGDEVSFVDGFAGILRSAERLKDVQLLVRPHPGRSGKIWKAYERAGVFLWPRSPELPDVPESFEEYRATLSHAAAVVGVNTSAFLEAACADTPCVALVSSRYERSQLGIGHFRHLLEADFLETAHSDAEIVSTIGRILNGEDVKRENRRKFVRSFLRPRGMQAEASTVAAAAVVQVALGKSASQVEAATAC